jgi:hypothetical protein
VSGAAQHTPARVLLPVDHSGSVCFGHACLRWAAPWSQWAAGEKI